MAGSKYVPENAEGGAGWPRSNAKVMAEKLREGAPLGFPADLARDGSQGSLGNSTRQPPKNRPAPYKNPKGGR